MLVQYSDLLVNLMTSFKSGLLNRLKLEVLL